MDGRQAGCVEEGMGDEAAETMESAASWRSLAWGGVNKNEVLAKETSGVETVFKKKELEPRQRRRDQRRRRRMASWVKSLGIEKGRREAMTSARRRGQSTTESGQKNKDTDANGLAGLCVGGVRSILIR